jgi:hypothetical protein
MEGVVGLKSFEKKTWLQEEKPFDKSLGRMKTYSGVRCAIGGDFNAGSPPNKSLKATAYRRGF